MFDRVLAQDVQRNWQHIRPLVERALHGTPVYDAEDIGQLAQTSGFHLWLLRGFPPRAFALTSFVQYGLGVWLRVWLGPPADDETIDLDVFEEFRRHAGCSGIEFICPVSGIAAINEPVRIEGYIQRLTYNNGVFGGEIPQSIFPVDPENVHRVWPDIEPLIKRVLGKAHARTFEPEHVRRRLIDGTARLLAQWGSNGPEALVVTDIAEYPRGKWVRIWLAATAVMRRMDIDGMAFHVKRLCKITGCRGFECVGRLGWMRRLEPLFPDVPIAVEAAVMRPQVDDPEF